MSFWTSGALRLKVAGSIVAAVSLGGFAVAAAAVVKEPAPKVSADPATTEPTSEPTTTPTDPPVTEPTTTPTDPPVTEPPPVVEPPATDPTCFNHGARVSKVAHDTPPGPGHGAAVSAAAHNHEGECHEQSAEDGDQPDVADAPESAPPAPAATDDGQDGESHDGGGTSNGHGHGGGRDK